MKLKDPVEEDEYSVRASYKATYNDIEEFTCERRIVTLDLLSYMPPIEEDAEYGTEDDGNNQSALLREGCVEVDILDVRVSEELNLRAIDRKLNSTFAFIISVCVSVCCHW